MPRSKEVIANIRVHHERVFRRRGFADVASRSPSSIAGLAGEHRNRKKELREIQRQMEEEKAKSKKQRDEKRLGELIARYNSLSGEQGAVRRALDMTTRRRGRYGQN